MLMSYNPPHVPRGMSTEPYIAQSQRRSRPDSAPMRRQPPPAATSTAAPFDSRRTLTYQRSVPSLSSANQSSSLPPRRSILFRSKTVVDDDMGTKDGTFMTAPGEIFNDDEPSQELAIPSNDVDLAEVDLNSMLKELDSMNSVNPQNDNDDDLAELRQMLRRTRHNMTSYGHQMKGLRANVFDLHEQFDDAPQHKSSSMSSSLSLASAPSSSSSLVASQRKPSTSALGRAGAAMLASSSSSSSSSVGNLSLKPRRPPGLPSSSSSSSTSRGTHVCLMRGNLCI
eukprot:GILJ01004541.1.p1 GENE.GILJ01004541.1~~GILJ01004541.1.p1  ORF type:complete len:283 (+),score=46.48 GILJ01004541.1:103-951(+)